MAVSATQAVNVGDKAPDFGLRSLAGDTVNLSDYRGKKTILFMWASW